MAEYKVIWEIDVEADTPEDAARQAKEIQRDWDPANIGHVYSVSDENGAIREIDLDLLDRLEYLRGEIRAERISQGELLELQELADQIDPGDVELLEWAGVPEFPAEACRTCGASLDDGEGWDGECGNCADRREA